MPWLEDEKFLRIGRVDDPCRPVLQAQPMLISVGQPFLNFWHCLTGSAQTPFRLAPTVAYDCKGHLPRVFNGSHFHGVTLRTSLPVLVGCFFHRLPVINTLGQLRPDSDVSLAPGRAVFVQLLFVKLGIVAPSPTLACPGESKNRPWFYRLPATH